MPMLQEAAAAPQAAPQVAPQPGAPPAPEQPVDAGPTAAAPGVQGGEVAPPEGSITEGGEQASPEEQAEYERAIKAAQKVIYENDGTSDAVIQMVQPDNKVESTVTATLLLLHQLDSKLNLDENVIAQFTQDLADMVIDVAEAAHGIQYSERELQEVLGATWENVMEMYGADEDDYNAFMDTMSPEQQQAQGEVYKQFVGD